MKTFEAPIAEVKKFSIMDVLTVSGCPDDSQCTEDCGDDEEPPPIGGNIGEFCV